MGISRGRAWGVVVEESVGNDKNPPPYLGFGDICSEAMQDLTKLLFVDGPSPLQVKCLHKREASHEEVAGMGIALKFSIDDDYYARIFRGGSTLIRPKGKEKVSGYTTFLPSSRVSYSVDGVVTV
jgi:hypothetical protein